MSCSALGLYYYDFEVPISKEFLGSPVQDPSGAVPREKSGYADNISQDTIKDFWETDACDACFKKKYGNSNRASYAPKSLVSLEIPKNSRSTWIDQLLEEERVEVGSIYSDYSCASSDSYSSDAASNSMVPFNNGYLGIPNAQQSNFKIGKVNNLTHQQFITDDGTEYLLRQTDGQMKDVKYYFDISHTKAWKNVLDTGKIVFLVGFSESFKKLISLKFYEKYRSRVDVFRLIDPEDWKMCYKRTEPFAIFIEDAFGPFGTKFESISRLIKNLASDENLEAALFMIDPLSFERNKESLRKCIKFGLADYVVHLEEEEHLLSEVEKHEILKKTSELVKEQGRSLTKQHIDEIVCIENPIFLDTCEEFVVFNRHDKNVRQFFSFPLDCLVRDIKYLKEKWADGYYVLRLVAFHEVFDLSKKDEELANCLCQSIHGHLPHILNQLVGSYLEIQNNEGVDCKENVNLSTPIYAFRHRMMQHAILYAETDKPFVIEHCPIGFLVDVIAQMTNMREISFEDKKRNIAKRFIQEILTGKQAATVVIHEIWNSEEFFDDFKQEWETADRQAIDAILKSACKSNFFYLAVFNKSPQLMDWNLKTFKVSPSSSLFKKAIFATCVVGHFEHFKLLMKQIKDVDSFCKEEFKDHILIPRRNTESSENYFDETKCYRYITHTAVAYNRLDILDYLKRCSQNVNYIDSQGCTSLHVACLGSDIEILEYLKKNNGDVANVIDEYGNTCLHAASCRYDNIEIVTSLVNNFPNLVLKRNIWGQTPLHIAARSSNTKIVELLIKISNKFEEKCLLKKDSFGCTVLHLACKVHDNLQMVKLLLERQPSLITTQDDDGDTVLHYACFYGSTEIVTWLVKNFPNLVLERNSSGQTPLHRAVKGGDTQIAELLISNKFQENCFLETDSSGCTVLHLACKVSDNLKMVNFLLERHPSLITILDHVGDTALHVASFFNNIEIVTSLATDFPNLVLKGNAAGQTPLHIAAWVGNTQIVELLIEMSHKFKKNSFLQKDSSGCTVLHMACRNHNNLQMVNFLLERQPSLITFQDDDGNTALHDACFYECIEIVTSLVKDFPNLVTEGNTAGRTPLHRAVEVGNTQIVELLIEMSNKFQNNSLLEKDSSGCTVLHMACRNHNNLQMVNFLLERELSLINIKDHDGNTALHVACFFNSINIVTFLVKDFPNLVLERNKMGRTPLHRAVEGGEIQIVKLLIEISNKFNKNCLLEIDFSGSTVLHLACEYHDNLQMVQFLLERQPSLITIEDHYGNTALHVACQTPDSIGVVEFLVSKGMDINMVNISLRTPLHKACMAENVKVVRFLLEKDNING